MYAVISLRCVAMPTHRGRLSVDTSHPSPLWNVLPGSESEVDVRWCKVEEDRHAMMTSQYGEPPSTHARTRTRTHTHTHTAPVVRAVRCCVLPGPAPAPASSAGSRRGESTTPSFSPNTSSLYCYTSTITSLYCCTLQLSHLYTAVQFNYHISILLYS